MATQEIVNLKEKRSRIETAIRIAKSTCNTLAQDPGANAGKLQAKRAEIVTLEADLLEVKKAILQAELVELG